MPKGIEQPKDPVRKAPLVSAKERRLVRRVERRAQRAARHHRRGRARV
jgi:hypothetical protein